MSNKINTIVLDYNPLNKITTHNSIIIEKINKLGTIDAISSAGEFQIMYMVYSCQGVEHCSPIFRYGLQRSDFLTRTAAWRMGKK